MAVKKEEVFPITERWTKLSKDGRIAEVRAAMAKGHTNETAAIELGTTPGIVAGIRFRNKIPVNKKKRARKPTQKATKPKATKLKGKPPKEKKPAHAPTPPPVPTPQPPSAAKPPAPPPDPGLPSIRIEDPERPRPKLASTEWTQCIHRDPTSSFRCAYEREANSNFCRFHQ